MMNQTNFGSSLKQLNPNAIPVFQQAPSLSSQNLHPLVTNVPNQSQAPVGNIKIANTMYLLSHDQQTSSLSHPLITSNLHYAQASLQPMLHDRTDHLIPGNSSNNRIMQPITDPTVSKIGAATDTSVSSQAIYVGSDSELGNNDRKRRRYPSPP